jgi:hypothetical protein
VKTGLKLECWDGLRGLAKIELFRLNLKFLLENWRVDRGEFGQRGIEPYGIVPHE